MRLPNGYGSISKLPGNRRNKFLVRKTVGTELDHEKGKVNYKQLIIGYALLWSSFFVTLVAKKYRLATMLPFVPRMVCDSR